MAFSEPLRPPFAPPPSEPTSPYRSAVLAIPRPSLASSSASSSSGVRPPGEGYTSFHPGPAFFRAAPKGEPSFVATPKLPRRGSSASPIHSVQHRLGTPTYAMATGLPGFTAIRVKVESTESGTLPDECGREQEDEMDDDSNSADTTAGPGGASPLFTPGSVANSRQLKNTKRAAQNRAAQRAFRERKDRYVKELEARSQQLDEILARTTTGVAGSGLGLGFGPTPGSAIVSAPPHAPSSVSLGPPGSLVVVLQEQLQEARERIRALERELESVRAENDLKGGTGGREDAAAGRLYVTIPFTPTAGPWATPASRKLSAAAPPPASGPAATSRDQDRFSQKMEELRRRSEAAVFSPPAPSIPAAKPGNSPAAEFVSKTSEDPIEAWAQSRYDPRLAHQITLAPETWPIRSVAGFRRGGCEAGGGHPTVATRVRPGTEPEQRGRLTERGHSAEAAEKAEGEAQSSAKGAPAGASAGLGWNSAHASPALRPSRSLTKSPMGSAGSGLASGERNSPAAPGSPALPPFKSHEGARLAPAAGPRVKGGSDAEIPSAAAGPEQLRRLPGGSPSSEAARAGSSAARSCLPPLAWAPPRQDASAAPGSHAPWFRSAPSSAAASGPGAAAPAPYERSNCGGGEGIRLPPLSGLGFSDVSARTAGKPKARKPNRAWEDDEDRPPGRMRHPGEEERPKRAKINF